MPYNDLSLGIRIQQSALSSMEEEKKLFVIAKRDIERGRDFDAQISELISSLQYLVHSSPVLYFLEESRKRMLVNPGTGGSPYGWSNFESK